ncbi:37S ribosomal protein S7 mitochondrial [Spathaspora sp. JA1]|nr:37S ribosomal protein S7 mitochondrial [Spathaspora sp. JA1]
MSLLRNSLSVASRSLSRAAITIRPSVLLRFNSTTTTDNSPDIKPETKSKISLTAQIYPLNQENISENDVDQWLSALRELKKGKTQHDTPEEVYLSELANPEQFLQGKFEPSESQLEEVEKYAGKEIPLRTDPTIDYLVNLLMRHGKKALARKTLSRALYIVQLKLRQDPVEILKKTLEQLAPIVKVSTMKTGFSKNVIVPFPLTEKQRLRYAWLWILEGADKKKSSDRAVRLAEEILAAYEGKSSGYDKRALMHKQATQQRSYVKAATGRR